MQSIPRGYSLIDFESRQVAALIFKQDITYLGAKIRQPPLVANWVLLETITGGLLNLLLPRFFRLWWEFSKIIKIILSLICE